MSWFDEQIRKRKNEDTQNIEDMYVKVVGSVLGKRYITDHLSERELAADEITRILRYYHVAPRELPDTVRTADEVLEHSLRPAGIMTREVKLEKGWHIDASGAMLARFKDTLKPVALIPRGMSGYWYCDPDTGHMMKVINETEKLFSTDALVFYKPFPMRKLSVGDMILYTLGNIDRGSLLIYMIFTVIAMAVGLLIPWQTGILFSDITLSGGSLAFAGIAVFMLCTTVSRFLFEISRDLFLERVSLKLGVNVESATMMRLLSMPVSFFRVFGAGDLANRVRLMGTVTENALETGFSAMVSAAVTLFYFIHIASYTSVLVVPAVAVMAIMMAVSLLAALMQARISRKQMESEAREAAMGYSLVSGIRKIKVCGVERRAFARWGRSYTEQAAYRYDLPLFLKVYRSVIGAVTLIGTLVIYYSSIRHHVSISEYYSFYAAYGIMNGAFTAFAYVLADCGRILPTLDMIRPILDTEPEISPDKPVPDKLKGEIEISNVTFHYDDDTVPIINDLSLRIPRGEYMALVGRSGCGKSTLMRILLGFETPVKGTVYYDKKDIRNIDLRSLRSGIGTVMQNDRLLTGDIFSNIALSAPGLTLDEAWEIAEEVGLAEDIKAMPMKMFTQISEGSGNISGGQKQLVLIARALAPKPSILIFDEATSALDNISQKRITEALDRLKCTKIIIAHRLSTVRQCDRIVVLDNGRIAEDGSYEELMEQKGIFAELVKRQSI